MLKLKLQYFSHLMWRADSFEKTLMLGTIEGKRSRRQQRMGWLNGIEICKISYVKRITSPGLMHDTGCSGLEHWDNPEGWDGEGDGRGVQDGELMYTQGEFKSMYGKTNIL